MSVHVGKIWFAFNELSAQEVARTRHDGCRRMDQLVDAVGKAMAGRVAELVTVGKLITLDTACRDWRRDPDQVRPQLPKCHKESEPTMQQFGDHRVFRDPRGEHETYELHAMVGSVYRIHLRIIHPPRAIEIGYIGTHLPTNKYH